MPVDHTIDAEQGIVFTSLSGNVTFAEFSLHLNALAAETSFRPDMRELLISHDAATDEFDISQIMSFKQSHVWGENARRALVADSELAYGLFRMFQITADGAHGEIRLFRDIAAARLWRGLE